MKNLHQLEEWSSAARPRSGGDRPVSCELEEGSDSDQDRKNVERVIRMSSLPYRTS